MYTDPTISLDQFKTRQREDHRRANDARLVRAARGPRNHDRPGSRNRISWRNAWSTRLIPTHTGSLVRDTP
jgi:hypothetical protein